MERAKYFFVNNFGTYIAIWYAFTVDLILTFKDAEFILIFLLFSSFTVIISIIYGFIMMTKNPVSAVITPIIIIISTNKMYIFKDSVAIVFALAVSLILLLYWFIRGCFYEKNI